MSNLKNKKILITAGPTWVPVDDVRVISNSASGETGILLAKRLSGQGAKVTLLLGPIGNYNPDKKIKLVLFRYFKDLKKQIHRLLNSSNYDAVIHSAAVADYAPVKIIKGKLSSKNQRLILELKPLPKIIGQIKKNSDKTFLVGFKFSPRARVKTLLLQAKELLRLTKSDIIVANRFKNNRYLAYLVTKNRIYGSYNNKAGLTGRLTSLLEEKL